MNPGTITNIKAGPQLRPAEVYVCLNCQGEAVYRQARIWPPYTRVTNYFTVAGLLKRLWLVCLQVSSPHQPVFAGRSRSILMPSILRGIGMLIGLGFACSLIFPLYLIFLRKSISLKMCFSTVS
jgi:hypothetical protein